MPLIVPSSAFPYSVQEVTITTNYVIGSTDFLIYCNHTTAITITLPAPTAVRAFLIRDISGLIETNNVTLVRHGSENIEGLAANRILQSNFGSWWVTSDGTNWLL